MQYCTIMQHCTTVNIAIPEIESCTRECHIATDDVPEAMQVSKLLHQSVALECCCISRSFDDTYPGPHFTPVP